MTKEYFTNEEGFECYKMECGCEGINIPGFGWRATLCDFHEEENDRMLEETHTFHKVRKFVDIEK